MVVSESHPPATTQRAQLPEGIRYYIVRPDKTMVPLVPADQLPFQLNGIPRQLSHQQLSSEKWEYFADTSDPKSIFSVRAWDGDTSSNKGSSHSHRDVREARPVFETLEPYTSSRRPMAPDYNVRTAANAAKVAGKAEEHTTAPKLPQQDFPGFAAGAPRPVRPQPKGSPTSLTASIANVYRRDAQRLGYTPVLPPSGVKPDASKKEYCTHWISRGECAFMAQGCLYKHEMPPLEKLREIGFKNEPRWWKEKNAIQSRGPTWMQRRLQHTNEDEDEAEENGSEASPKPGQESVHDLFKRIKSSSDRAVMKQLGAEESKTIQNKEKGDPVSVPSEREQKPEDTTDLIDLGPSAPTSSRRSSGGSLTSGLSTDTNPSSCARSGRSETRISRVCTNEKPRTTYRRPSVPRENFEQNPKSATVVPSKRSSSTVGSKSVRPQSIKTASTKPTTKDGLAQSKHAVSTTINTMKDLCATAKTPTVEGESAIELRKQVNKLQRDLMRT